MTSDSAGPDFSLESEAIGHGLWPVAGIDEAGRGPWAGPVVAAAVILDPKTIPQGLNDSKKLSAARRDALFDEIVATSTYAIASASAEQIDRDNILRASLWAMAQAIDNLGTQPTFALIDGNKLPQLKCEAKAVVKGDGRCLSIAAASIIAKVTRDRLMMDLAAGYPGYGWERNKGYGTREHSAALARLGPTPYHRYSFKPVAELGARN